MRRENGALRRNGERTRTKGNLEEKEYSIEKSINKGNENPSKHSERGRKGKKSQVQQIRMRELAL